MLRKCLCLLGQSHKLSKQHTISSWTTNVTINTSHSIALVLQHGHFNIPRFQTKVEAVQLNTLRRLMSGEDAHCKHFPGYLLRVSSYGLRKWTLILDFSPRQIECGVPTFHSELLIVWYKHKRLRTRIHIPDKPPDILNEPLFHNDFITVNNQRLAHSDWVAAGITQVKEICYEAIPDYLPTRAVHELRSEYDDARTLQRTARTLSEIQSAIAQDWTCRFNSQDTLEAPDLKPPTLPSTILIQGTFQRTSWPLKLVLFTACFSNIHKPLYLL